MDTSLKILDTSKQHCKSRTRRKRGKKQMSRNCSKSPLRNLGVVKQISKRNVRKKIRISDQCLNSIVQDLYEHQISLMNTNTQKNIVEYGHWSSNLFEQTIDLCDGDSSIHSSGSSVATVPSHNDKPNQAVMIDLSDDLPKQKEVIDLTETVNRPVSDLQPMTSCQPNVIDISDEISKEEPNLKSDNDEIFVIGTFSKTCDLGKKPSSGIPLSDKCRNFSNLITCSEKLKKKYLKKHSVLDKIDKINKNNTNHVKKNLQRLQKNLTRVGENVYVNSPVSLPSNGLRPIIIDGSNVAFVHSNCNFSCKRLEICINYFKEKGHKVTAFVPQFRLSSHRNDDPQLLRKLEKQGDVVLTPSKKIDGRNIVPYDDRFIVQTAVLKGGIIVTRDNYNDLLKENPAWAETIKYRTLAFTWVDDVLMFPKDPLGEYGPTLEQFLRFH